MKISPLLIPLCITVDGQRHHHQKNHCPKICPPCKGPFAVSTSQNKKLPICAPGTGLVWDKCACCRMCAAQINEKCSMFLPCDDTKGLECQDTNGQVTGLTRGSEGVCKPPAYSRTCFVKGEVYNSGDQFNPEGQCEVTCVCVNGDIGCYPTCPKNQNEPPTEVTQRCPDQEKLVKAPRDKCCPIWTCPGDRHYNRPKHAMAPVFGAAYRPKPVSFTMREDGCPVQTTEWSACSRNCGWGIRERVTNDNEDCDMRKETVLCQLRPCHYELIVKDRLKSESYKTKACLKTSRPIQPVYYEFSGCKSEKSYKPRYCGYCKDERCCEPKETENIDVTFSCPNDERVTKKINQIKKCECSNKCKSSSIDIFSSNYLLTNDVSDSNLRH